MLPVPPAQVWRMILIFADPLFCWLTKDQNKFRAMRGLTSSGRKARGMSTKSANLKVRPSLRANNRQGR